MSDNKVSIDVELAIAKAQRDLEALQAKFSAFSASTVQAWSKAEGAMNSFKGNLAAIGVTKVLSTLTDAAEKLFDVFIVDGVKASAEAEEATTDLNAALAQTGKYTQENSKYFLDLAGSIQATTVFEDENVKKAEALIQTLGDLDKNGLTRATKAAVDLAAALSSKGVSLTSAADLVGKAAAGNTAALGRYGIVIDQGGTKAQRFAEALTLIEDKFGGRATAQVNTYNGAIAQSENRFNGLQETTGDFVTQNAIVVNLIKMVGKAFDDASDYIKTNKGELTGLVSNGILAAVDGLALLLDVGDGTIRFFSALGGVVKEAGQLIVGTVIGISAVILNLLSNTLGKAMEIAHMGNPFKDLAVAAHQTFDDMGQDINKTSQGIIDDFSNKGALGGVADYVRGARDQLATHINDVVDANGAIRNENDKTHKQAMDAEIIKRQSFLDTLLFQVDLVRQEEQISVMKVQLAKAEGDKRVEIARKITLAENELTKAKVENFKDGLTTVSTLMSSKSRELFFIGKAAALASATINGFEAVTKAFAQGGILGYIMGPLVAIAVGAQIAGIAAQQPGFANGGITPPGIIGGTSNFGDAVGVRVNSGEMLLNKQQQAGLFNFVQQGSQGGGGGGGDTYNFYDTVIDSPQRVDELIDKFNSRVKSGVPHFASRLVN